MFKTLRDAWAIPELRKKLMFTIIVLLIYRACNAIPVPFVDVAAMNEYFNGTLQNTILGFYNVMNGSAFANAKILALGIQPYINASIIIQLLCVAIPALERWSKEEGEEGKKKINNLTRLSTVALGLMLGFGYYTMIANARVTLDGTNYIPVLTEGGFWPAVIIVLVFTAGSSLVMWMGEQITEHGIGNGISMVLFANIVAGLPGMAGTMGENSLFTWWAALIVVIVLIALVVFIVFINDAERRIPIAYAKRVVGRKVYGGQNTNLPIKVAMSGVMPVIFAQSVCSIPSTVFSFYFSSKGIQADPVTGLYNHWGYDNLFSPNCWAYIVFYGLMIFFFSWFYAQIQYDPMEISNNLKKNGGFIPGFRPGKPTADFIKKVIGKIVIFGAVYLAIIALLPIITGNVIENLGSLSIGGTSIIIVVGVALETVKAIEAQMLMRHYKGFLD